MVYQSKGKWFFLARKPGTYKVTLFAVTKSFLVSEKSLVIEVKG